MALSSGWDNQHHPALQDKSEVKNEGQSAGFCCQENTIFTGILNGVFLRKDGEVWRQKTIDSAN